MERLTFDTKNGNGVLLASITDECEENHSLTCGTVCSDYFKKSGNSCKGCPMQNALDRLAEYERTGLEPADITAMQAEKQRLTAELTDLRGQMVKWETDKAPDKSGWYLITNKNNAVERALFMGGMWMGSKEIKDYVIAWTSMPAPYAAESARSALKPE
jgi:hypothetical protein